MLSQFLVNNREYLVARCAAKVSQRITRKASSQQIITGIPIFLEQLIKTLGAEENGELSDSVRISGQPGGDLSALSEMGVTAAAHGRALLDLNYTVDQVVHDYGDLCQSVTDLAQERDAPFSINEYRTLNRCLDNAIAIAVTEFSEQRDIAMQLRHSSESNQRLGYLMHELRNALNSAALAVDAMRSGNLPMGGATGAVLKRSHDAMSRLIKCSLEEVKSEHANSNPVTIFTLSDFVMEAYETGKLEAESRGINLVVLAIDLNLIVEAHRDLLQSALGNLIGNALKFTLPHTTVTLKAHAAENRVLIEVSDHCGGLRHGDIERIFIPFSQRGDDKTGVGLGLSIARESVRADGGNLTVRDVPGQGCVFTISLPILDSGCGPSI